jgi:EAL domain-containing protein (putative c-di-GMP-specific phosphodiesterase class I)
MELEVLESSLFEDFDNVVSVLDSIKNLGLSISLDDFGTGYSSLAYLYRLPISVLKIDRAFISRLEHDAVNRSLCTGILSIAQNLTLSVVAEGVENEHQFDILKASACDRVQGYLFSKPVLPVDATRLLQTPGHSLSKAA